MQARMANPAAQLDGAFEHIQGLFQAVHSAGVDKRILDLVHLRVSQVNGCSACVYSGATGAAEAGETDERLVTVAAWRDAPFFSEPERTALELAEHITVMAHQTDEPVPDQLWSRAREHFDEKQLSAVLLMIAVSNLFNRLNAPVRAVAGSWT